MCLCLLWEQVLHYRCTATYKHMWRQLGCHLLSPMSAASSTGFKAWHGCQRALTAWVEAWDWRVSPYGLWIGCTHSNKNIHIQRVAPRSMTNAQAFATWPRSRGFSRGIRDCEWTHAKNARNRHPQATSTVSCCLSWIDMKTVGVLLCSISTLSNKSGSWGLARSFNMSTREPVPQSVSRAVSRSATVSCIPGPPVRRPGSQSLSWPVNQSVCQSLKPRGLY